MTGTLPVGPDLTVTLRRSLGRRLAAIRMARNLKNTELRTVGSRQKIGRLESGQGPFRAGDIREFCHVCGVSAEETEQLVELAQRSNEIRLWDDYSDLLPGTYGTLVDLEGVASRFGIYEPEVVPGLLQTADYTRAVTLAARPRVPENEVERYVAVRQQRQLQVFDRPVRARIMAVLSQAVLSYEVGGADVAATQRRHLQVVDDLEQVDVRVITFASGAHASMRGALTLLQFDDPEEPTVAYLESRGGSRIVNRPAQVAEQFEVFESLLEQSVPLKEHLTP
jgi:hypothetical protein